MGWSTKGTMKIEKGNKSRKHRPHTTWEKTKIMKQKVYIKQYFNSLSLIIYMNVILMLYKNKWHY